MSDCSGIDLDFSIQLNYPESGSMEFFQFRELKNSELENVLFVYANILDKSTLYHIWNLQQLE